MLSLSVLWYNIKDKCNNLIPKPCRDCYFFKKNGPTPASFSFIFLFFKHTLQILQQIDMLKNVHPVYGAGI